MANIQNIKDCGLIAAMLAGPIILRYLGAARMTRVAVLVGLGGCGVLITAGNFPGVMAGAFLHGATFSLGSLATVTYLYRLPARYRRISGLYATFSIASIVAPALVSRTGDYRMVYLVFAAVLGALLVAGIFDRSAQPGLPAASDPGDAPRLAFSMLLSWLPDIAFYATLMAAETVVVSWVTSLAQYHYGLSLSDASFMLALLWVAYTPARAAGDMLAKHLPVRVILLAGAALIVAGDALICSGSVSCAYAGVVVFAAGTAPLVPVYQGWVLGRTPASAHGSLNASLGVGAAAFTTLMVWLTGLTVEVDPRIPFAVSASLITAIAACVLRRRAAVPYGHAG